MADKVGTQCVTITNGTAKAIVGLQAFIVTFMYIWFVLLRWGAFVPVLMFYQHYLSAIASGLGCLMVSVQYEPILWAQFLIGACAVVSSGMYLSQIVGDESLNFEGTVEYPKLVLENKFTITAYNTTPYDFSYGLFVGDIVLTFVELFIQNLLFNMIIPGIIISNLIAERKPGEGSKEEATGISCEHCEVPVRSAYSVFGILIVITGIVQGFLSWYFLISGVLLLTPLTNLNYMIYFVTAAGIAPAWRADRYAVDGLIRLRAPKSPEDDYYADTRPSAYNVVYMMALAATWALTVASIFVNISWSQQNYVGGGICPTYENTTLVMSGQQTLKYFASERITYNNLTSTVIVNSESYQALVELTENNIKAVFNFTCSDIWFNWVILGMFTIFMGLNAGLLLYPASNRTGGDNDINRDYQQKIKPASYRGGLGGVSGSVLTGIP